MMVMAGIAPKKPCPPFKNKQTTFHLPNINNKGQKMKELAEQELKLLEANHPTRFQYLKLQLKELIHLLDEGNKHHSHSSIITQESSTNRKREREGENDESKHKIKRPNKGRDAIHKAEACLYKIQTLKSFFFSSNQ